MIKESRITLVQEDEVYFVRLANIQSGGALGGFASIGNKAIPITQEQYERLESWYNEVFTQSIRSRGNVV